MSRWFRHYASMARDEKLVRVAVQSRQTVERVVWVWCAILESAAEINNEGLFDFDAAEAAYFLRADEADICRILTSLQEMGRIHENTVVKWGDRQFSSDAAAERQKRYRERRKASQSDDVHVTRDVTPPSRDAEVTLQETETETYKTTLSREVDLDDLETKLREAAGKSIDPTSPALMVMSDPLGWISAGADLSIDILPAIRARAQRAANGSIRTWAYFKQGVADARARRMAGLPEASATAPPGKTDRWGNPVADMDHVLELALAKQARIDAERGAA